MLLDRIIGSLQAVKRRLLIKGTVRHVQQTPLHKAFLSAVEAVHHELDAIAAPYSSVGETREPSSADLKAMLDLLETVQGLKSRIHHL